MIGPNLVYMVIGAVLAFQLYVTYRIWRTAVYDRQQKSNQWKLVWMVPLLGAAIVFSAIVEEESYLAESKTDIDRRN